ncbi:MAG: hypothetical protein WBB33_02560 [Candidatus Saccharimonadales bacterium]
MSSRLDDPAVLRALFDGIDELRKSNSMDIERYEAAIGRAYMHNPSSIPADFIARLEKAYIRKAVFSDITQLIQGYSSGQLVPPISS